MRAVTNRIFLHVGSPKTGTTFLQQVLWSQRDLAEKQGLLLPLESFNDHYLATLDVRGLTDRPDLPARASGIWGRFVQEASAWDGNVLISHELFAPATAAQATAAVEAFGPGAEVHVVLTARDLVRQIPAEWQEHVKHRSTASYADFVAELRQEHRKMWFWMVQDFARVLQRWTKAVPAERVHVVTVPPAGARQDLLWERFARLLGLDPTSFDLGGSRANTSLGYEQAERLRRVNVELGDDRLPIPGPYPVDVKEMFAQTVLVRRPGAKIELPGDDVTFAVERSRRIADKIEALGFDVVGDLGDLVPDIAPEKSTGAAPEVSDRRLLDESVAALAGVLEEYSARRKEAHQAQRALTRLEQDIASRPVRVALKALTARWAWAMTMRKGYWRAANLARDLRNRRRERVHAKR
jgi:hypothetical protein